MDEITLKNLPVLLGQAYKYREAKELEKAFEIAKTLMQNFPKKAEVQCLYGILQLDKKQYFESEKAFNTAISLLPDKADFYYFLGELLKEQRRFHEAENAYTQCLKLSEKHLYANLHLANLLDVEGRLLEAIRYYKNIIEWYPDFQKAYYHLAVIYHKQNKLDAALKTYKKALELDPKDISALSNMGAALTRDRRFEEAIPYYEKAIEINPNYVAAITNLGGTYIEMNDFEQGRKYMRQALELDPNLPPNWRNLTLCTTFDSSDASDLNKIQELMKNPKATDEDNIHYNFAIGKIYDDFDEYDKAYEAYKTANDLQAKKSVFVPQAFSNHVHKIMGIYDIVQFNPIDFDDVHEGVQPIIIMGTARSGKTLLEALLLESPEIGGVGELGIADIASKLPVEIRPRTNYPYWLKSLTIRQAKAIRHEYLERLTRKAQSGERYIIDTMPGNFMYLGLLGFLFPGVKIIHCQREPLDACLLMYFKYFIEGHGYSYDLGRLGRYYRQYLHMMSYWKDHLKQDILDVDYENLVQAPEETLKKVMNFLALPDENFKVEHLRSDEVGHYKHYEKYLDPLKDALEEEVALATSVHDKEEEMKELMGSAYLSYQQGDTTTTEILCSSLLEHDKNHYAALHLLGMVHFQRDELDKAIECLEHAVAQEPNTIQLQVDISRVYKALGKQVQSEHHIKTAEILQHKKQSSKPYILTDDVRHKLMSALNTEFKILDEFESRLLLQAKIDPDELTDSFMTRSWDQYFTDLSYGSYRTIQEGGRRAWRMRTWHFLYKNISLVENILNQTKPEIRILDIGCSTGYLRRILEGNIDPKDTKKLYYWGLDIRKDVLEDAVKGVELIESGAQGNLMPSAFVMQDIKYGLPFKDSHFDYVVNFEMIKYLPIAQGKALLSEIYRVLNPKGLMFLSTSYSADQPGFIQSMPYEQLEDVIKVNGFDILTRRGSQSQIRRILPQVNERHAALVQDLLKVHPPEMVAAMITPLYPQTADQVTFICRVSS